MLGTDRSKEVRETEGQERVRERLAEAGVQGLAVIGGGGSMTSALELHGSGVRTVGIPATVDNDIPGTELAIGVDTAVETAVEIIDRIRGTVISHNRAHVVEVAGRDCGYLALMSAIAGGAEAVVVPEFETRPEDLLDFIKHAYEQGKSHFIAVVSEGAELTAGELQDYVNDAEGAYAADLTSISHTQTGGDPTAFDRILAARLGAAAIETLADGESGKMVGVRGENVERVPLEDVSGKERELDPDMYRLAQVLAEIPQ